MEKLIKKVNKTDEVIFQLLQAALFQKKVNLSEEINWEEIWHELEEQTVSGLVYEWISQNLSIDQEVQKQWMQSTIQKFGFWHKLMYEQEELIQLMKENSIEVAILKGAAAAVNYSAPEYRTMGDIDFLVKPEKYKEAYHILLKNGYYLAYPENHVDYHFTLERNGIVFEIHRIPVGVPDGVSGDYIKETIKKGMNQIQEVQIQEFTVPVLPPLQNGLVLILHIAEHLRQGLGLRQIIDWMMFADRNLNDKIWYAEFQSVFRKAELEKLAIVVTRMCQIYLGLDEQKITWCLEIEETLCHNLMEYIMEQGNFGRKVGEDDKVVKTLAKNRNIIDFCKLLQRNGSKNWKLIEKYHFLYPFAWCYQICRYIHRTLKRKNSDHSLIDDISKSSERRKLFYELGIMKETNKK